MLRPDCCNLRAKTAEEWGEPDAAGVMALSLCRNWLNDRMFSSLERRIRQLEADTKQIFRSFGAFFEPSLIGAMK